MMTFQFSHYQVPDHVYVQTVDNEVVLLNTASGKYFGLDPIGARMWLALTEQQGDPEAAMPLLLAEYDVDEARLRADLAALLDKLVAGDLLTGVHD